MVQGQMTPLMRAVDGDLPVMRRTALALGVAPLCLNILDVCVNDLIIGQYGGYEANPLIAPLIGGPSAMLLKVGICVAVIALGTRITKPRMVTYVRLAAVLSLVVTSVNLGQVAHLSISCPVRHRSPSCRRPDDAAGCVLVLDASTDGPSSCVLGIDAPGSPSASPTMLDRARALDRLEPHQPCDGRPGRQPRIESISAICLGSAIPMPWRGRSPHLRPCG